MPSRSLADSVCSWRSKVDRRIARTATDLAWGLWRELGVPGVVRIPRPPVLDLEWLIVHTPFLCSEDPRLDELAFGWCVHNHSWVSTRRLRAVAARVDPGVSRLFWAWAAELRSHTRINWIKAHEATPSSRHIRRSVPDLDRPSLAALRFRSVFGVGARADIICALVAKDGEWLRASDLVKVGYTKNAVATVLKDLTQVQVLASKQQGNAATYTSTASPLLRQLLRLHDPLWIEWRQVFKIAATLVHLEADGSKPEAVRRVAADQARRDILPAVIALGWPQPPKTAAVPMGHQSMLHWGLGRLEDLLGLGVADRGYDSTGAPN